MSEFSPAESMVIDDVMTLMTDYVTSYVHSDRDAFRDCFEGGMCTAVGDRFVSNAELRERPRDQPHYFELRRGHWSPPLRTQISVNPINGVSALSRVRWVFPETPTGSQYLQISMYLCVKTDHGWKIHLVMLPGDNGDRVVTGPSTYQDWDVERWPIHLDQQN